MIPPVELLITVSQNQTQLTRDHYCFPRSPIAAFDTVIMRGAKMSVDRASQAKVRERRLENNQTARTMGETSRSTVGKHPWRWRLLRSKPCDAAELTQGFFVTIPTAGTITSGDAILPKGALRSFNYTAQRARQNQLGINSAVNVRSMLRILI